MKKDIAGVYQIVSSETKINDQWVAEEVTEGMFVFTDDARVAVVNQAKETFIAYTGKYKLVDNTVQIHIEICDQKDLEGITIERPIVDWTDSEITFGFVSAKRKEECRVKWKKVLGALNPDSVHPFTGVYSLLESQVTESSGNTRKNISQGGILVMTHQNKSLLIHRTNDEVFAYIAHFEVQEDERILQILACSAPEMIGSKLTRKTTFFDGKKLISSMKGRDGAITSAIYVK